MNTENGGRALRDAASVELAGPGHFAVTLSEFYTIMGHPHGGYLQCVMANGALAAAAAEGATHLHPTAVTTNFIAAPSPGPAVLRTEVRRVGRAVSFVHVIMVQNDVVMTESLVTLGTLHEDSRPRYVDAIAPTLAPLEECRQSTGSDEVNIMRVVDLRLDPGSTGWRTGEFSDRGEIHAWARLDDGQAAWDAWSVLFASDALPPATFPLGSTGWVPTLQLTSYVRRIPTSDWLRARQWCVVVADGLVDERCELFDDSGQLVATSNQLAMVRFPGGR